MEVTALCIRTLLNVLLLLAPHVHHSYAQKGEAGFLHIVPTRLQFFEYESVSFTCEAFDGSAVWRGVRNIEEFIPTCSNSTDTSTVTCTIYNAFETDSGEYWCEADRTVRSKSVHISVTAGPVILESPALPVTEGDAVTLSCRNKTSSDLTADFYKDGLRIGTGYKGNMTIHHVSKSDAGLYKCHLIGVGESAESWLAVTASSLHKETHRFHTFFILCITVATCLMALMSLVVGLCLCGKHRVLVCIPSKTPRSGDTATVSGLTSVAPPQRDQYSHITAVSYTEPGVSSLTATPAIDQCTSDEYAFYCTID